MVTTQTVTGGGEMTATGSADGENDGEQNDGSGEDGDQEDAAGKGLAFSGVLLGFGLFFGGMISLGPWI